MKKIFYNNTVYTICGKSYYRFDINNQEVAVKVEKQEKKDIESFLESRKQDIFKSERLNKIAAINPELKEIEGIEKILDTIESVIPENYRKTFYKNLKTAKIYLVEAYNEKACLNQGTYDPKNNSITINMPEYLKTSENFDEKTGAYYYNLILLNTLIHELFHLASSKYDKEKNIEKYGVGYQQSFDTKLIRNIFDDELSAIACNHSLNEGITDLYTGFVTNILNINIPISYNEEVSLVMQLAMLTGIDTINDSYFNTKGTILIQKNLRRIIKDPVKAEFLMHVINQIERIDDGFEKTINYFPVFKAEYIIIDYIQILIESFLNIGDIERARSIFDEFSNYFEVIFNDQRYTKKAKYNNNYRCIEEDLRMKLNEIKSRINSGQQRTNKKIEV